MLLSAPSVGQFSVGGNIQEVQDAATKWQWSYNHDKPSIALNGLTPIQKLQAYKLFHQLSTKQWC
jgi:hypothetical protein